jgi:NADPH:quinone reductase-like Zn-dependent oxidoreductase
VRQVWIERKGRAEDAFAIKDAPDPTPGPGEVRVRVTAAGINFADTMARKGLYMDAPPLPCVVGYEVSGTIDALGEGVEGPPAGTRVLAMTRFGGYSSCVCLPADQAVPVPDGVDLTAAAAIPVTYLTAWHSLRYMANLQPGERVLLHAAAGGVGLSALQIARHLGAGSILGTASPGKHTRLLELGLTQAIDYRSHDFEPEVMRLTQGQGVHVVMDAVGGSSFRKSYRSLAATGRLVMFGASTISEGHRLNLWAVLKGVFGMPKFGPIPLMTVNRGVFGVNMLHVADTRPDLIRKELAEIVDLVGQGVLSPVVDRVFPHTEVAEAHVHIESRKNFGKVLLDFSDCA